MTLDAYTATVLRLMDSAYPDLGGTVTDATHAREIYRQARFPTGPEVALTRDLLVAADPPLPIRIYQPVGLQSPAPVVVYCHGGGFVLCDLDTHDGICRLLADRAKVVVVSVGYRLAPEQRFPAASEDAYLAAVWASRHARQWGGDPRRLVVAGDSAGGALSAATALRARERGYPEIALQLLIYPVTDSLAPRHDVPDSLLTQAHMRWFNEQYLATAEDAEHPYASPLRASSLAGLPPAVVITAEHDPLCVEGEAYATRLSDSGVPVSAHRVNGFFHGLFGMGALVPVARIAEDLACDALRDLTIQAGRSSAQSSLTERTDPGESELETFSRHTIGGADGNER
jgi:acetyl esterase